MGKNRNGGGNDEEVIRLTGELAGILDRDPSILASLNALLPNLEKFQQARDRHRNLFGEVLGGAADKEEELQAARNDVLTQISYVHGMAQLASKQDPSILQKLGKKQQPTTKRGPGNDLVTENFRLAYEGHNIIARGAAVKGAKCFEIWLCEGDPLTESNWRHHITSSCINRIEITGLTPGKLYYFRVRALGSHATGPWSNFVSMMAI